MQATPILTVALGAALLLTTPALSQPGKKPGADGGLVPFLQPQVAAEPAARNATPAADVKVGERYPDAHIITEPGRYGLSVAPEGTIYAVIGRSLVRIDQKTFKVQSVLRTIEGRRD